jgi:hypothetical protein
MNIEPAHWEKLKVYWNKPKTKKEVKHMVNVRNLVKNLSNVGRLGRAGKETRMVSAFDNSRLISITISLNEI